MSLLALRKYWKKLRSWCFHHWRWLVLLSAAVALFFLGRKSNKNMFRQAQAALKTHELEKRSIERMQNLEIKKREEARTKYNKALKTIEERYESDMFDLSEAKKKEMQKNLKKVKNNPKAIDNMLMEEFGIREVR